MSNKTNNMLYGIYDDADQFLKSAYKMKEMGVPVEDCYTPHPVHGIEKAMGIKRTRLTIAAFLCGLTGTISAVTLEMYTNIFDWPMNIGGKPNGGYVPAFIPVTFELTVLFTAFGMMILFFYRNRMVHGQREKLVDLRQTDDLYIIAINMDEQHHSREELSGVLMQNGAIETREKGVSK
jgi:hypothetical protein